MSDSWADRPPPSWKKSNSFKTMPENGGDAWSSPSSPRLQPDVSSAPSPDSGSKVPGLHLATQGSPASPTSPKAAWDHASQAINSTTPRLPPPPAAPARADSMTGAPLERQSSHRKTTSWGGGGSPTSTGRSHRRTRSIEGLGASMDASENFRAELERIGSSGSAGAAKPSGQPAERPALALSPPKAPVQAPHPVSCRSSVGSPLKHPMASDAIPPLNLAPGTSTQQVKVAAKAAAKEQELISWDEVKDQKEVYRAVRTADGRQALVKAGDGADQEELLFLEDPPEAAPDMSVTQGSHASAVYYVPTTAGHGPMYAYPVQYPDGRIMYHVLPPQVMSPVSSPHAALPHGSLQNVASPPYLCSPTAASTPPGHQRRSSVGTPSPLRLSSVSAFGSTAFANGFGAAPMAVGAPHMYANSSGPLSPQLSQASSGFIQGASPNRALAMSPAGSGHLPYNPSAYSHSAQADHTALLEQLAGMRLAAAKDDPFGGSAVWAT